MMGFQRMISHNHSWLESRVLLPALLRTGTVKSFGAKAAAAALLSAVLGFGGMAGEPAAEAATRAELARISVKKDGSDFKYWNEEAVSFRTLTRYVEDVTDPASGNYIPVEDRIAVFDLDGTLACETAPSYFVLRLYLERALNDPSYTPSMEDRACAEEVKAAVEEIGVPNPKPGATRRPSADLVLRESISQARVFEGMTLPKYERFVKKVMREPAEGLTNLRHGEAFYLPMVEVLSYLRANRFKTFIVSASDRQTVRILVDGVLPVDMDNIIGTDISHVASHQGDAHGTDYTFAQNDEILRGGFASFNMKMSKVANIVREIGRQPVLAFGNSSGDAAMFNYTVTRNKYRALAFSLICDDLEREMGSMKVAEKMRAACGQYGWVPISMRDDFKTIYGDGVTRKD